MSSARVLVAATLALCGAPSSDGGQVSAPRTRVATPSDVALPSGYRIEAVATGLTFPTA